MTLKLTCECQLRKSAKIKGGTTKTIGKNQGASNHGRHTFLDSSMRDLVCNEQLWASAVLKQVRSYKVGQREYSRATFWWVKTTEVTAVIQYILTATQSSVLQDP